MRLHANNTFCPTVIYRYIFKLTPPNFTAPQRRHSRAMRAEHCSLVSTPDIWAVPCTQRILSVCRICEQIILPRTTGTQAGSHSLAACRLDRQEWLRGEIRRCSRSHVGEMSGCRGFSLKVSLKIHSEVTVHAWSNVLYEQWQSLNSHLG